VAGVTSGLFQLAGQAPGFSREVAACNGKRADGPATKSRNGTNCENLGRPNKRMQLTKLRAAPERQDKVPPCAPAGGMDGGTASQLIRSVRRTRRNSVRQAE
jgi:hypothetical protein